MTRRILLALAAAVLLALSTSTTQADAESYVIAANPDTGVNSLTQAEIRDILSGKVATWPDGRPVVLVVPPKGSPAIVWACLTYVKVADPVYRRYLQERAYRGGIEAPVFASSDADVATRLGQVQGGVGPAPKSALPAGVRVIEIR